MDEKIAYDEIAGVDPWTAAVSEELAAHPPVYSHEMACGMTLTVQPGLESLWLVLRGTSGGGAAFRTAYAPGAFTVEEVSAQEQAVQITLQAPGGMFQVAAEMLGEGLLHWTTALTPAFDLTLPFSPHDVYPLDAGNSPVGARGTAHVARPMPGSRPPARRPYFHGVGAGVWVGPVPAKLFRAGPALFETLGTRPLGLVGGL